MSVHGEVIDELVAVALDHFRAAPTDGNVILKATIGLDLIGRAVALAEQLRRLSDDPCAGQVIPVLLPALVEAASPDISAEQIAFGLGCANAILIADPDEFHLDRMLHMGALLAGLRGHICRVALSRRGDPLSRNIAIRRAFAAEREPGAPVN